MHTEYQAKNLMIFHLNQMEHTKKNGRLGVTGLEQKEWRIDAYRGSESARINQPPSSVHTHKHHAPQNLASLITSNTPPKYLRITDLSNITPLTTTTSFVESNILILLASNQYHKSNYIHIYQPHSPTPPPPPHSNPLLPHTCKHTYT